MRKRQEEQEQQERPPKRKRRRFSKFRFYFINIFFGVVIVGLLLGMLIYFGCDIKTVNVKGNTLYTAEEIEDYVLDDAYSYNSVYAMVKNLLKPPEDIPFVESVKVRMGGLNSVTITVTEKKMIAYLTLSDGTFAYFDGEGVVQEVSERLIENVLPVTGITCEEASAGDSLPVETDELDYLTALLKGLEKYEITPAQITFAEDGSVSFLYAGIEIRMGKDSNLEEKLMRLPRILPYLEGMTGILHLENWSPDNTDIVFKRVEQQ